MRDQKQNTTEANGCCTSQVESFKQTDPCCEQPSDGSECCDKSAPKSTNSEKTGCC